jgi:hypothetical protein
MKSFRTLSLVLGATLLAFSLQSGDAFAKKKDKGGETESAAAEVVELIIEDTGLKAIDDVFAPSKNLVTQLTTARDGLNNLNKNLVTAMGLAEGTPAADALAELKKQAPGMLKVTMDGMKPKIDVKPEAPANVKAAVDAINAGGESLVLAVKAMTDIPEAVKGTIEAAKALPAQIPTAAKDAGLKPTEVPGLLKKVKNNVATLGKMPDLAKQTGEAAKGTAELIKGLGQ